MSLIPYLLERQRLFDKLHDLSFSSFDDDLLAPFLSSGDHMRDFGSIKVDKNKFQVNLDVHHFAPEEITVKTVDGSVVIEGIHEEKRDDHGWVSRRFIRRCPLPEGCNAEAIQSRLSSDGVLSVEVPLEVPRPNERIVPIVATGPVRKQSQGMSS